MSTGSDNALRTPLTDREREILAFEQSWWQQEASKERAARDRFDLGPTRYYQTLSALIDRPEALAADPLLVRRLRRRRDVRRLERSARRLDLEG